MGIYIHIPYCASRCIYCDFYSSTGRNRTLFVQRLLEEARIQAESGVLAPITTVYIGGGTPSQLSSKELNDLIQGLKKIFDLTNVEEFTMEMNPEDVTEEYIASMPREINRVSMGVQSFSDEELKTIRRRHNAQRPEEAIQILRKHGIENISIDLMYGLPEQTLESFNESITKAISLNTPHISAYCLSVEEDTPLSKMIEQKTLSLPDDELCNSMNELLRNRLKIAGFIQYEISNYAQPGFESRHNSSYWDGTPYIGLGPGAHSYDGQFRRYWNEPDLSSYLNGTFRQGEEFLSLEDRYNEAIMLGLRTSKGVNIQDIAEKYSSQFKSCFAPHLPELIQEGLIHEYKTSCYALTESGLALADAVIRQLVSVDE